MKVKIKDIAEVINGSTPSTKHPEYYDGNIIWITPKDLSDQNSKYVFKGERTITQAGYNSCSTKIIPKDNILISSRAPIGLISINKVDCCTNQGFKSLIIDKTKCDEEYLYYYLKYHIKEIEALGSGTTFREVSKDSMEKYEIELPDLVIQKQITSHLASLDKKIIVNNNINSEFESLVKTIYDYWFQQFDFPNNEGKPYKSSGGKMVYNEQLKKDIPEGWEVKEVLDLVDWVSNSQPPKSQFYYEPKDGYVRFIQNRDYDSDSYKTYIPYKKSLSIVNKYDILMDKYGDAGAIRYGIEGVFNVALGKIHVKDRKYLEYIRSFLGSSNIYTYLHNSCMASTRASLSEENLKFLYLVIPNNNLLEKYEEIIHNIRELILKNKDESRELVSLRDFLSPLLINGQVTIE